MILLKIINLIMHYPKDEKDIAKLQDITNRAYIQTVEKIMSKSNISINNKKKILGNAISMK